MSGERIGVLTTSYPRHPDDPAGRFVAELCAWLADVGHAVDVLAPHPARTEHPGVEVHGLRYALAPRLLYGAGAPDNLSRSPTAWAQVPAFTGRLALSTWRGARRWDRVVSHWLVPCGLVAARCARGLPHLAIAHSSDVALLGRMPLGSLLLAAFARQRAALVLTSSALRPALLGLARTEVARDLVEGARVIRMGIDDERLTPRDPEAAVRLRRRHGLGKARVVLFVGRLVPVKGVDLAVRALAALRRDDTMLVVAGAGPERDRLGRLARRLRLPARFLGEIGGQERDAWLQAADLFVLPSRVLPDGRGDSAPVALLEAMAARLPVVASRTGGNAELVTNECGLLVPPDDTAALGRALGQLLDDGARRQRLGRAAQEVARRHTWDRVGAELRELMLEL